MNNILVFSILLSLLSCNNPYEKIEGEWERYEDHCKGMTVKIKQVGELGEGTIVKASESAECKMFFVNDIKFSNIEYIAENQFRFETLIKHTDDNGEIITSRYARCKMTLISDDRIETRLFAKGEEKGTVTNFRKIK